MNHNTLSITQASPEEHLRSSDHSDSSSELSVPLPLKQLQRLRPHLCFSSSLFLLLLLPSMKFTTIFAKQIELGSRSPELPLESGGGGGGASKSQTVNNLSEVVLVVVVFLILNWRSKRRFKRDFGICFIFGRSSDASIGWIFVWKGIADGNSFELVPTLNIQFFFKKGRKIALFWSL